MENYKYLWLEKEIREGTNKQVLAKETNGRTHGAISCPTGYGKSGIIFDDVIWHIKEAKEKNCKLVVNICAPILLLCCQNISDLLELLVHTEDIHGVSKDDIITIVNNSGKAETINSHGIDCVKFNNFKKEFNSSHYKVAIVISCNKSLDKFTNLLSTNIFSKCIVCSYLDEAHTLSIKDEDELSESGTVQKVDLVELSAKSNYCYLISATNNQELVRIVNNFETNENDDSYIYKVDPSTAIENNIICGPAILCYSTDADVRSIAIEQCKLFFNKVKNTNPAIHHKILVSTYDTDTAEKYAMILSKAGHTVFLTTAATGQRCYRGQKDAVKKTYKTYKDVLNFSNDIKNYDGDCFVIHIRQLISGIDISGLTDCIIFKNDLDNYNSYDTLIQTIGRCLRLGEERGIDIDARVKKCANVLFVTNESFEKAETDLSKFFIDYYGVNCVKFDIGFSRNSRNSMYDDILKEDEGGKIKYTDGTSTSYMSTVRIRIEDWLKNFVFIAADDAKRKGLDDYKPTETGMNNIILQAKEFDAKNYYTTTFFDDDRADLRKFILDSFNNYKNNTYI